MNPFLDECDVFCRYLIGRRSNEYVANKYQEYHRSASYHHSAHGTFDNLLLVVARLHPVTTQIADAYARVACRHSILRKKLILLLAIMESCAPFSDLLDEPPTPAGTRMWVGQTLAVCRALAALVVGVVVFGPWQFAASVVSRRKRGAAAGDRIRRTSQSAIGEGAGS